MGLKLKLVSGNAAVTAGLKSDQNGIETEMSLEGLLSDISLKSDQNGIETAHFRARKISSGVLKSDQNGIEI